MKATSFDRLINYKRQSELADSGSYFSSWLTWLFKNELNHTQWPKPTNGRGQV